MSWTYHRSHINSVENVTLTPKEQTRLRVLNSLLAEHMTMDQAAELMGVSPRHTRRMLATYRRDGAAALAHGHRGRQPTNATPEATRSRVGHLARTMYEGANHTHLSELLSEREGIDIGSTTLRRILVNAGLASPRGRRPPKHRVRRQRMPREGMLIQLDGSHHRWLGEDGPQFALLFAVDDATGAVVNALFYEQEDSISYFRLTQGLIRCRGIPLALYTDRHPVFKHRSEYQPAATATQFGRAMEELGVQLIFALSPQAKGRVERMAVTFQDRLITETPLGGSGHHGRGQGCLEAIPVPVQPALSRPSKMPGTRISARGAGSALGAYPVFQAPQESGQGRHREVPQAHPADTAQPAAPQLCRGSRRGAARSGRPAVAADEGRTSPPRMPHRVRERSGTAQGPLPVLLSCPRIPRAWLTRRLRCLGC